MSIENCITLVPVAMDVEIVMGSGHSRQVRKKLAEALDRRRNKSVS